jgi:exonuclease III
MYIYIHTHNTDLLIIQETKMNEEDTEKYERKLKELLPDHVFAWNFCTRKKSYSGTLAIIRSDGNTLVGATVAANAKGKQASLKSFFQPVSDVKDGDIVKSGDKKNDLVLKHVGVTMNLPTMTEKDGADAVEANGEGRVITVEYEKFYGKFHINDDDDDDDN